MNAVHWEQLPEKTRDLVEDRTGPVVKAEPVNGGHNHHLATVLHTATATLFLKGVCSNDRRARRQRLEAALAADVAATSPRLRWHLPHAGGWNLLAFQAVIGAHHANLAADSTDLPLVSTALTALGQITSPPVEPTDPIEKRWAEYATAHELQLLHGDHLLHTDLRPDNILVDSHRAWIVDWSWPARGAAWIDPACLALWRIAHGQHPADAETWLRTLPASRNIPSDALDAFTTITTRLWSSIAADDPQPWKTRLAYAATAWATHRASAG